MAQQEEYKTEYTYIGDKMLNDQKMSTDIFYHAVLQQTVGLTLTQAENVATVLANQSPKIKDVNTLNKVLCYDGDAGKKNEKTTQLKFALSNLLGDKFSQLYSIVESKSFEKRIEPPGNGN